MIKKICIFGDSIAFGDGDLEFGGWQNHLKVWFTNDGGFQHVYNLAISGRTSGDIIGRLESELVSRKSSTSKGMLSLITVPINDTRFIILNGKREFKITTKIFRKNLQKIIEISKSCATKTVLVGPTSVVDDKTIPWTFVDNGHCWENAIIKKYNQIIKEVAEENDVPFCPMFDLLKEEDLDDGLHPNAQGHQKIFKRIKNFLEEERVLG
jgi:lysophospholipase L1-like esterase